MIKMLIKLEIIFWKVALKQKIYDFREKNNLKRTQFPPTLDLELSQLNANEINLKFCTELNFINTNSV